jgi:hypothetical protein
MPVRVAVEKSHEYHRIIGNLTYARILGINEPLCALCPASTIHQSPVSGRRDSEMDAFIEVTETPDFVVAKPNGTMHVAVNNVRWFGSLIERNNRAKGCERTFENIFSGSVLFGLESLSLLD